MKRKVIVDASVEMKIKLIYVWGRKHPDLLKLFLIGSCLKIFKAGFKFFYKFFIKIPDMERYPRESHTANLFHQDWLHVRMISFHCLPYSCSQKSACQNQRCGKEEN